MTPMESIVEMLAQAYIVVIIIAAVLSWMRIGGENQIVQGVQRITEPTFRAIRATTGRYVPALNEMSVDVSPIIAILLVHVAKRLIFIIL